MALFQFWNGVYPDLISSMDEIRISTYLPATVTSADAGHVNLQISPGLTLHLSGSGLTYSPLGQLTGGTINYIDMRNGFHQTTMNSLSVPGAMLWDWLVRDATSEALATMFAGSDQFTGSDYRDLMRGYDGHDMMQGRSGGDSLFGGSGNDTIFATSEWAAATNNDEFLRGEEGDDSLVGGSGFDDIHGNQGHDTAFGGQWNDWVVGGQGNDLLTGGSHADVVYGNLGNDTLFGDGTRTFGEKEEAGVDWVRGGQGDDSISAGGGADLIWGDRGNDTISGGAGADAFHFFAGAGLDRVLDFNAAEGDRVILDGAPAYTLRQSGADTIVDLGAGDQLVLVGVSQASLPPGWIG